MSDESQDSASIVHCFLTREDYAKKKSSSETRGIA